VEDESGVRKVIRNVLRAEGYTVLEAGDGLQAKIIFEQHPGSIDLLVGDVMMPGLGGPALVRKLRRERPLLPVLLISGFADPNVIADEGLATTHTRFLAKPFTNESLAAAVRESIALQPSAA
jgi:two-component system cell cycle sensor histidine kinase/response regulator CckA